MRFTIIAALLCLVVLAMFSPIVANSIQKNLGKRRFTGSNFDSLVWRGRSRGSHTGWKGQ